MKKHTKNYRLFYKMKENEFIEFLRWCLLPTDTVPSCTANINWQELLGLAKKQTVVGLYLQGIQRLGDVVNCTR